MRAGTSQAAKRKAGELSGCEFKGRMKVLIIITCLACSNATPARQNHCKPGIVGWFPPNVSGESVPFKYHSDPSRAFPSNSLGGEDNGRVGATSIGRCHSTCDENADVERNPSAGQTKLCAHSICCGFKGVNAHRQSTLKLRGGGIAGFQRWFVAEFPEAVINVYDGDGDTFDHVAFDMNGLVHSACLKAKTIEHAVLRVFRELDATLRVLQPRKSVVLAFDGPGPLAKLLTQRKRRLKASRQSKYKLSGLNITPGTEFMYTLRRACEYFAASRVAGSYRFRDVAFYISGSDVAGEGEVKIIEWLHTLRTKESGDSIIIVGGDADLVLQGLATYSVRDLFVFSGRSTQGANSANEPTVVLSLWEVVRSLER